MRYSAVIFDLDGTLIDTERQMTIAGMRAFEIMGIPVPDGFFDALVGVDFKTGLALIASKWPDLDFNQIDAVWAAETKALHTQGIPTKPGVDALLNQIDKLGLPKAIATSSFAHSAERKLKASGLAYRFETVISVDSITNPKPAADPYLFAAQQLGVPPESCLAFEDSETGSQSAYAAGMTVVLVPDVAPVTGRFSHHRAADLLAGAKLAGLL
ncbi:HAD family hydrolase [Pelagimonas varians]|uniref:Fructose-1-phosphate phosphatase YqaB n=1 Tax=Pelagimonas varians TaxID=696760 RepID=A0A238K010_9RHOB|nr:HAD family phosphatase [Pelagimonas varians]PYG33287.1 HAD superfamily hydrolase (TIGR01509 family) [Pelagimonas varians]SMX36238.1 Fructose-1-phosphate phosphatase YqaB [Pelagimonas varians]